MKRSDPEFRNGHARGSIHDESWNPLEAVERHFHARILPDVEGSREALLNWLRAETRLVSAVCAPSVDSGRKALVVAGITVFVLLFGLVFLASLLAIGLVTAAPGREVEIISISAASICLLAIVLFAVCRSSFRQLAAETRLVIPKILSEGEDEIKQ